MNNTFTIRIASTIDPATINLDLSGRSTLRRTYRMFRTDGTHADRARALTITLALHLLSDRTR